MTIRVVLGCAVQRAGLPTRSFALSCLDESTLLVRRDRDFRHFAAAVGLPLL